MTHFKRLVEVFWNMKLDFWKLSKKLQLFAWKKAKLQRFLRSIKPNPHHLRQGQGKIERATERKEEQRKNSSGFTRSHDAFERLPILKLIWVLMLVKKMLVLSCLYVTAAAFLLKSRLIYIV